MKIIEITVESARTLPNPHQAYATYKIAASATARTNPDAFSADFLRLQDIVESVLDAHNERVLETLQERWNENAKEIFGCDNRRR